MELDEFRRRLGRPVYISPIEGAVYAEDVGHSDHSWHYTIQGRNDFAMAADVFPDSDLLQAWLIATQLPFYGIGIYPYWQAKIGDKYFKGGLHLDVRFPDPSHRRLTWWCDKNGIYHNITTDNIGNLLLILGGLTDGS